MAVPPLSPSSAGSGVPPIGNTVGVGPAMDPTYLAFLRANGYSEDALKLQVAEKVRQIQGEQALKAGGFANALGEARGGIQDSFQDRGMYSSGARMQQDANAIRDSNQAQAEYRYGTNNEINNLLMGQADSIAKMRQDAADKGLVARDTVGTGGASALVGKA